MQITPIPFDLPGRVFRSPMPYGEDNKQCDVFQAYLDNQVDTVVMLAGEAECREKAGRDLKALYREHGMNVLALPVRDYGVPALEDLRSAVNQALELARQGHNLAVHCRAGVGRTGMFLAAMAKVERGLTGDAAVAWVRQFVPKAVETDDQYQLVCDL